MDPVTIIVAALVSGVSESLKENASQAISDAYQGLKSKIIQKWSVSAGGENLVAKEAEANVLMAQLEDDPEVFKPIIEKKLSAVISESDTELLSQAQAFHSLLKDTGVSSGVTVNVSNSKGVQIGDSNTQTNSF